MTAPLDLDAVRARADNRNSEPDEGWPEDLYAEWWRDDLLALCDEVEALREQNARLQRNVDRQLADAIEQRAERDRLRAGDRDELDRWQDFSKEIVAKAPDHYDGDDDQETIALRYVRDLEAVVAVARQWGNEPEMRAVLDALDGAE